VPEVQIPKLYTASQGTGCPVVWAHGFGGSARNFMVQARAFRDTHRTWLYDARGHARSAMQESDGAYGWDSLVSDLANVVTQIQRDPACSRGRPLVVGGLSMGAATALFWALKNPDTVDGLVLAAYPESNHSHRQWAHDFAERIERVGVDEAGAQFVWGPHGAFAGSDAGMIRRGFLEHSPRALAGILRQSLANIPDIGSLATDLGELRVPTLIIVGGEDEHSLVASRALAASLPVSRLAIIEHAGHVVNLARPAEFNRELARFFVDLQAVYGR
jgi:3-oxoadipate enol-lactonase